jgi:imidazolonepropionase
VKRFLLWIRNASMVVQVCANGEQVLVGAAQNEPAILSGRVGGYSVLVDAHGNVASVGVDDGSVAESDCERVIDARGRCVLPGFVDGHTHPVWAGDRVHEFKMKLAGATYMEIHAAGGGIGFTVRHTRDATEDELERLLLARLDRMLAAGSTTVEAKSGYGLECEAEMKLLRVMHRSAVRAHAVELSPTYLGAHSVPKGITSREATDDIVTKQIPRLVELRAAGVLACENVDVFVEQGVYSAADARRILRAGTDAGLRINFHGDELHLMRSGELAEELKAAAVSHLELIDDAGIAAMERCGAVAVLLPTTAYILRLHPPPARKMIDAGVAVALGSDFNPNAHCLSMPMTMNMACVLFRMTLNEALVAATINSAASIGRAATHGSIEVGKRADLILTQPGTTWEHLIYEIADPPIAMVVKGGRVVHEVLEK